MTKPHCDPLVLWHRLVEAHDLPKRLIVVQNKIDLMKQTPFISVCKKINIAHISAKTGDGIPLLLQELKKCIGFIDSNENVFSARRRHIVALEEAYDDLRSGAQRFHQYGASELLAEDLCSAQRVLGMITGEVTNNDLLGRIFSDFCIGK